MSSDYEAFRFALNYDAETGVMSWARRVGMRGIVGRQVGCPNAGGYLTVRLDRKNYPVHRVAWLLTYGCWPVGQIDHINGIKTDNRLSNLRDVPAAVNRQNLREAKRNNKAGVLGVSYHCRVKRWSAAIRINGIQRHLGYFDTKELAGAAYVEAKRAMHPGCTL